MMPHALASFSPSLISLLGMSALGALAIACNGSAPPPALPAASEQAAPPPSETTAAEPEAAAEPAPDSPPGAGAASLKGTLDGKPFAASTALVRPSGKDVTVRIFDGDGQCSDFSFAKKTNVMMIGSWTDGKARQAKLSFVTYDAEGVPFTRPFDSAKITFGKKPTKDASGTMALEAGGDNGKIQGDVKAILCP